LEHKLAKLQKIPLNINEEEENLNKIKTNLFEINSVLFTPLVFFCFWVLLWLGAGIYKNARLKIMKFCTELFNYVI